MYQTGLCELGYDLPQNNIGQTYGARPLVDTNIIQKFQGILQIGPYLPCLRMADRALLAGYPHVKHIVFQILVDISDFLAPFHTRWFYNKYPARFHNI